MLILDANGVERYRIEGYLPVEEFRAQLELGLARVAFMSKDWPEAERRYGEVLERYPDTKAAADALYWQGVSHYKGTNDHTVLGKLPAELQEKYPDSLAAMKSGAWIE